MQDHKEKHFYPEIFKVTIETLRIIGKIIENYKLKIKQNH
jgi:hypothetical protein